ncbi:PKD domain-containing protein [Brachybacterium hainanense]|uniref:PKD domain-containing protein n=1 Tax=Brachybacterium hainanense TaxID=1541174 RepID=A0ABV6R874_9MICO
MGNPSRFSYDWKTLGKDLSCVDYGGGSDGRAGGCAGVMLTCGISTTSIAANGRVEEYAQLPTAQVGTRHDRVKGASSELDPRCNSALLQVPGGAVTPGGQPVIITVTRADFAELPVAAPVAHAGPERGWLPVHMDNVLYAEEGEQTLESTVLGVPVRIRAVPVEYRWDLGDGNTVTTTKPGKPYPSTQVTATYDHEGWYDVTLTTEFAGQYSVAGGEWQDIDGTITVESEPKPIYSKSLESRLVNPDVPVDEDEDPWIPERTADTEGPQDPDAEHRTL